MSHNTIDPCPGQGTVGEETGRPANPLEEAREALSWLRTRLEGLDPPAEALEALSRSLDEAERIDRRRRADWAHAEERFGKLFHGSPISMSIATLDEGRFLAVNDAFLGRLGYSREEVVGRTSTELGIWDDPDGRDWILETLPTHGSSPAGRYVRTVTKAGEKRHARVFAQVVHYGGQPCILAIGEPLEERLRAEEEIGRLRRFYEQVLTDLPAEVAVFDVEGRYLYLTPSALRDPEMRAWIIHKTDYDYCCLTGMDVSVAYRRRGWLTQTIEGKILGRFEESFVTPEGQSRHFIRLYNPVLDGAGEVSYVISYGIDVTDLKRLEEQISQAQKMEAVGRLAGGVAHDFNNLLTAIIGTADLMLNDMEPDGPFRGGVEDIRRAGERATSLTRQLLAFSRRQVVQPVVLNLNAVLKDMETILRRMVGEHILLTLELEPGLAWIKADATQVEQVVMNLAVNARDAMPEGGSLAIRTANANPPPGELPAPLAAAPPPYVMLEVRDSGCGMDDEVKQHIFEPFYTTKAEDRGTGLGLSTVYGIVDNAGGHIGVESEPGRGALFRIYFPRAVESGRVEVPRPAESQPSPRSQTVLLVEDEEAVRNVVRRILDIHGYRVLVASDGMEALEVAGQEDGHIHLLLSDVVMPRMSGRELAERIRNLRPATHVLFMSGHTDDLTVHQMAVNQPTAFIQKPFSASSLVHKIREILDED